MKFRVTRILLIFLFGSRIASAQSTCPLPPTAIQPSVNVEIVHNPASNKYTYQYTFSNGSAAQLSINMFILLLSNEPSSMLGPERWRKKFHTDPRNHSFWSTISTEIAPGKSRSGFEIQSSFPPGTVKYLSYGDAEVPTARATEDDDEPMPDCPGFYFESSWENSKVAGVTKGPVPAELVSAEIKIRHKGVESKNPPRIESDDKGKVQVLLLGSDKFDVAKVDIASVRFGVGEAKAVASKFVNADGEGQDKNLKGTEHKKNLLLDFDLKEVGVRCNVDRALFLSGKINAKDFLAGAPIEPDSCQKKKYQ